MKKFEPLLLWAGALLVIATVLLSVESDLLWKTQQNSLFLHSSLFFKQTMAVSGGLLSYLGAFFTQFFYYPWVGVVMLCGWWLLLMWLTKRAFNIPDGWCVITLIPMAILLIANMALGYWVYVMKLPGYFFAPTIGTTIGVALLWLFRVLPQNVWIRSAFIVLSALVGYPLMGAYALCTVLLMGVWSWRLSTNRTHNAVTSIVALLAAVAMPLVCYRYVFHQTNLKDIYTTALPHFTIQESYPVFMTPYYVLAACFLALVIVYPREKKPIAQSPELAAKGKKPNAKSQKQTAKGSKPLLKWALQGALLAALAVGVWHFWYKDDNFHHELRMQRCMEKADWEGILEEGKAQTTEPTRSIVMMHNLALSRLGRQCDEMYNFPKGSNRSHTALPVFMYNTAGRQIYYHYGVTNECHRLCMEEGVEYGWSVELLQYMARTALMNGEQQAARKFLNLLRETLFYGEWADHMEQLLLQSGLLDSDQETGPILRMMHYGDIQSPGDGFVEKNLMTMLAQTDANDPYFQEQAVLAAMWTRNPAYFWPRFETYVNQRPGVAVPRIMQEAAYLFASLGHAPFIDELPVDQSVKTSFQSFMTQMQQYHGAGSNQAGSYLYPNFGNTYFFEYFFLRDITYF